MKICKLCDKIIYRREYCQYHYRKLLRNSGINRIKINGVRNKCKIEYCNNTLHGKGLCKLHYQRLARYGRTENIRARGLTNLKDILSKHVSNNSKTGCLEWKTKRNSYPTIHVNGLTFKASRYVLEQKLGRKIKKGYYACHKCDNPSCVNEEHIYEGTAQDNVNDKMNRGRYIKPKVYHGANNIRASFTWKQVKYFREIYNCGKYTMKQMAVKFNVNFFTLRTLLQNKTYKESK